jgi:hypothetical protein
MNYAAEMGSDAKFHKDWFTHSKVNGGVRAQADTDSKVIL